MGSPERTRRSRRQWEVPEDSRPTSVRDVITAGPFRNSRAETPGAVSSETAVLSADSSPFTHNEHRSAESRALAWDLGNGECVGGGDRLSLSRAGTQSRPPSSLAGRSVGRAAGGSGNGGRRVSSKKKSVTASLAKTTIPGDGDKRGKNGRGKVVATQQKSKQRERVWKSRNEEFKRTLKMLEGGCRVLRPRQGKETAGELETPSLDMFAELQKDISDRWKTATVVAKHAIEAVIEAEKMLEYISEFWVVSDMLKQREWDAGVDGFLRLHGNLEEEYAESEGGDDDASMPGGVVDQQARASPCSSTGRDAIQQETLDASFLNTGRSAGSGCSTSSLSNAADLVGEDVTPSRKSSCSSDKHESMSSAVSPGDPLTSGIVPGFNSQDLRAAGPIFEREAEEWFLKVVENAFGHKQGVYSQEDCCTLLNTLSKVQDWLETEPVKTRAENRESDVRLLVRDVVIYWGSQLFYLPPAMSKG